MGPAPGSNFTAASCSRLPQNARRMYGSSSGGSGSLRFRSNVCRERGQEESAFLGVGVLGTLDEVAAATAGSSCASGQNVGGTQEQWKSMCGGGDWVAAHNVRCWRRQQLAALQGDTPEIGGRF